MAVGGFVEISAHNATKAIFLFAGGALPQKTKRHPFAISHVGIKAGVEGWALNTEP